MDFSMSSILAMIVFGVSGIYVFREGKRRVNYALTFIGIALMMYSYFVPSALLNWLCGGALLAAAYYFR